MATFIIEDVTFDTLNLILAFSSLYLTISFITVSILGLHYELANKHLSYDTHHKYPNIECAFVKKLCTGKKIERPCELCAVRVISLSFYFIAANQC